MRDTHSMARFREEDKTPPPIPQPGPPSPPVHPKVEALLRKFGVLRLPIDPVKESRMLRAAIVDLARDLYETKGNDSE